MNIVVLDKEKLPDGVEFPFLQAAKYGWVERPTVEPGEIEEVAWRAHVVVTAATPIPASTLEKLPLLKMVVIVGDFSSSPGLIDLQAAASRGVLVSHVPGGDYASSVAAETCCSSVVENIDAMIAGSPINLIDS